MNENSFKSIVFEIIFTWIERFFIFFGFVLVRNTPCLSRKRIMGMDYRAWDYNRYSSLELCAYEILNRRIEGAIAELGVYQGVFASKLNEVFPERNLYLFDTFEGFEKKDIEIEKQGSTNLDGVNIDFTDTAVDYVLKKMRYKDKCIIKKGYFPDTVENLDEKFAFVSIDADLYKPILDGLVYFYPRLTKGGYIFIHDFNNIMFPRAKEAVMKFCSENGVNYFPLSDVGGTVVISK
jgi:O-methyltransferase